MSTKITKRHPMLTRSRASQSSAQEEFTLFHLDENSQGRDGNNQTQNNDITRPAEPAIAYDSDTTESDDESSQRHDAVITQDDVDYDDLGYDSHPDEDNIDDDSSQSSMSQSVRTILDDLLDQQDSFTERMKVFRSRTVGQSPSRDTASSPARDSQGSREPTPRNRHLWDYEDDLCAETQDDADDESTETPVHCDDESDNNTSREASQCYGGGLDYDEWDSQQAVQKTRWGLTKVLTAGPIGALARSDTIGFVTFAICMGMAVGLLAALTFVAFEIAN